MKKIVIIQIVIGALISLAADVVVHKDEIINKCRACHGFNFERSAFDKSKIVANLSKEDIIKALKKYKNTETFKSSSANLMKSQISEYTDDEIEIIASQVLKHTKTKDGNVTSK